jgi:hypothetical protein
MDLEGYEFCRPQGGEADDDTQHAVVDVVLGHRVGSALDEVRLVRRSPGKSALSEERCEEVFDRLPDAAPKRLVVRFEDDPLEADVDAALGPEPPAPTNAAVDDCTPSMRLTPAGSSSTYTPGYVRPTIGRW